MKAPHFWSAGLDPKSREAAPVTRALLTPLEALYIWGIRRKIRRATPWNSPIPVVCVGNLTTGGSGKTPIVDAIRLHLVAAGKRAASLSRGYGGSRTGPLKVDAASHSARDVGDEPLMLAGTGEAWIGRDRSAAVAAMADNGVDVVVMDDGHQNPSVAKTLSLVIIDSDAPFGNGYVLPKGPLREPVADGLARADAVVLVGDGPVPADVTKGRVPCLRARIETTVSLTDGAYVAFAGIGRPAKFFGALTEAGIDVREAVGFADHHTYSPADLDFLRKLAVTHGATLLTTSKDLARLQPAEREGITDYPVRAVFEDIAVLDALLGQVL